MTVTEGDRLSPMPTPHSRRGRRRGLKVVVVTFLMLVIPFLVLELGIRLLIATDRLPSAPSHSEQLDVGLINVRKRPAQDVLLMGDSQIATGMDPAVLRQLVEAELGGKVPIYDFGQPGTRPNVNRLLLDLIAREGRVPKVIVLDISMTSLVPPEQPTGNTTGEALALVDEEGRPTLLNSALGREIVGCDIETEIVDRIDCEIAHLSAAWRWHGRPERVIRSIISGAEFGQKASRGKLREDGFFARHPAKPGRLQQQIDNADYAQSRIQPGFDPSEAADYRAFAELAEANGATVIFVQVPLTKPYAAALTAKNPEWEAQRRAALEQLEAAIGRDVVYVEAYGDDWWTDQSASDLNHLSAEAAVEFTKQLWDMPDFRAQLIAGLGGAAAEGSPVPGASAAPAGSPASATPVPAVDTPPPAASPAAS